MSFAENLKRIRVQKGFTLDLLQEKTGISKRMISGYESGENDITLRKLQNIASVLNISISDLLSDYLNTTEEPEGNYEKRKCLNCNDLEKQVQYWKGKYEGLKEGLVLKNEESYKQTGSE